MKKYIVDLTAGERDELQRLLRSGKTATCRGDRTENDARFCAADEAVGR